MRHLPLILVLIVTILVFGQVVSHEYLSWDDDVFLYQNPHTQPPTIPSLKAYWTAPYAHLYAPVTYSAWWLLARTFGAPGPGGVWVVPPVVYHTASLLAHLLPVSIAYLLLVLLVRNRWAAGVGALLFAIHPLQVEAVAWASELKDLLSGMFGLLAVLLHVLSRRRGSVGLYVGATVAFVLAILSKPNLVALPLLVWVVDWLVERPPSPSYGGQASPALKGREQRRPTPSPSLKGREQRTVALWLLPWLVIAGTHVLLTRHVQPPAPDLVMPLWQRLFVAGDSLAFYLGKLFLPVGLTADYGRMPSLVVESWWGYVTWLAPAALLAVAIITRKRSRWALPGLLWFSLALLPVLGLLPFDFQQYSTVADHYAYLAMFGPALALAGLALHLKGFHGRLPLILLFVLLAAQSGLQTISWNNNQIFWQHTMTVNPKSFLAHNNLGAVYTQLGKLPQAAEQFELALQIKPDDADTLVNLGMLQARLGQTGRAKELLEKGLRQRPGDPKALLTLGMIALQEKQYDTAISRFQTLLEIQPEDAAARYQLAVALLAQGRKAEARAQLEEVLRQVPEWAPAREALKQAM
ncbi:MAG: tetratricopeptide repeat protein [Armatimonadota bacterium]